MSFPAAEFNIHTEPETFCVCVCVRRGGWGETCTLPPDVSLVTGAISGCGGHLGSDPLMMYKWQNMADGMTCFMDESKWYKSLPPSVCATSSSPPPPSSPSVFIRRDQTDGDICLFMNTEVTCNQPERAPSALRFRPVSTTAVRGRGGAGGPDWRAGEAEW